VAQNMQGAKFVPTKVAYILHSGTEYARCKICAKGGFSKKRARKWVAMGQTTQNPPFRSF